MATCRSCGVALVFTRSIRRNGRVYVKPSGFYVFCPTGCRQ